jgi:glycerol-3-phosphate O-acyltransferase
MGLQSKNEMDQDDPAGLMVSYIQKMRANYSSPENLKITPDNVFQEGITRNLNLFMEFVDRLMLPGSRVEGAANLLPSIKLLKQKKSFLFLMKHQGNFDAPCFYSLLKREGEQYQDILNRLVFIAGRKLNEDSIVVKTFAEILSRLIIVPKREIPLKIASETEEQVAQREQIETEARRINRAALRMLKKLKDESRIIVLYPLGGRPKPWLQEKGVKETTSYMRMFDYIHFITMAGNVLEVRRDMREEKPRRDQVVFTISEAVLTGEYRCQSRDLYEKQTEEADFDQFNVNRVMKEIGQ